MRRTETAGSGAEEALLLVVLVGHDCFVWLTRVVIRIGIYSLM